MRFDWLSKTEGSVYQGLLLPQEEEPWAQVERKVDIMNYSHKPFRDIPGFLSHPQSSGRWPLSILA